ncbi:hypothetical protein [Novosphingobium sp.]|uniref:hypothetical protein n=1 Tax=Novosphingobium sp. TaxID=1874826 RepID=UPI00261FD1C4|nr:hypothetical protein [Novosphingobium sp.]
MPAVTPLLARVAANDKAADPSNAALVPLTSPVSAMVRPVAHLVAVAALPVQEPDDPVIDPLEVMQPSRGEPGRNGITYRQHTHCNLCTKSDAPLESSICIYAISYF